MINHPDTTSINSDIPRPVADNMSMVHMGETGHHHKGLWFYKGRDSSYAKAQSWAELDKLCYFPPIFRPFDFAILKWYSFPALVLILIGMFHLDDELRPVASVEEVSELYEQVVLNEISKWEQAPYIMKWSRPIVVYIDDDAGSDLKNNIKKRMDQYAEIAGVPVKYSNKRNGRVDVTINFLEGLQYDKQRKLTYLKGSFSQTKGNFNKISLNVSQKSFKALNSNKQSGEKLTYDTEPLGRQLALNSFGLPVKLDFTLGIRRDRGYRRYRSSEILLALHYHRNLAPMRSINSAKGDIYQIATEMTEASSFDNWLSAQGRDVE